jgi:hypothetical protein
MVIIQGVKPRLWEKPHGERSDSGVGLGSEGEWRPALLESALANNNTRRLLQ